jgi:peptidoglycan hydrolase-like protein with peptidoglycan-binding domain
MRITRLLVVATAFVSTAAFGAQTIVEQAQTKLAAMGYKPGPANGIENKETKDAVKRFQKSQKLDASGQLDTQTLAALNIQPTISMARSTPRSEPSSMASASALPGESSGSPSSESTNAPSSESTNAPSSESTNAPSSESSPQSSSERPAEPAAEQSKS